MNKSRERAMHIAKMKDDLYKLLTLVGSSKTVHSFKITPGETINVILYTRGEGWSSQELPIGEFPLQEALSYLLGEALS